MIDRYWTERPIRRAVVTALLAAALSSSQIAWADVTLNFANADIDQIARAIGAATGKTIIVDPRVKGQLSLQSERPVSDEQALKTMQAALRMQGFALVEDHGVLKVVPESDAKLQGVPTYVGNRPTARGDTVITQVFQLRNESANTLLPVIRPLISPNNTVAAYPSNNTLVVTDYADNVRRIAAIIAGIDNETSADLAVMPLANADATDVVTQLQKLLDPGNIGNTDPTLKIAINADARTNSVILRASNSVRLKMAEGLVRKLDAPTREMGNIHVVPVLNGDAVDLAKTLRRMLGKGSDSGSGTGAAGGNSLYGSNGGSNGSSSGLPSGNGSLPPLPGGTSGSSSGTSGSSSSSSLGGSSSKNSSGLSSSSSDDDSSNSGEIVADASTNSLIITAPEPVFRNLRNIIAQLDKRRVQVYIESLIMEINAEKTGQFGIQWLTPSGLATLAAGTTNVGIVAGFGNILGTKGLFEALQTDSDVNILSTPSLMTLNNQEARILVGSNIPLESGSYSTGNTTSTSGVSAFNTFDRQDVGIMLNVKPQVSQGGTVKLQIYQEDSAVQAGTANQSGGFSITKRSLQTSVLADDGQIIVLGGLISDSATYGNSRLPWVSKIPLLGALFRNETKDRAKTNLLIFLRPVIVKDSDTSSAVSLDRYGYSRAQSGNYRSENWIESDSSVPVLPPVTPRIPQPVGRPVLPGEVNGVFDLTHRERSVQAPPLPERATDQPPYAPDPAYTPPPRKSMNPSPASMGGDRP